MKILIIDKDGVKEFIPSNPNQQSENQPDFSLQLLKDSLLKKTNSSDSSELSLYTISKLVKLFSTTRPTIYSWIGKGFLKPIKLGGRVYFNHKDIESLLESGSRE